MSKAPKTPCTIPNSERNPAMFYVDQHCNTRRTVLAEHSKSAAIRRRLAPSSRIRRIISTWWDLLPRRPQDLPLLEGPLQPLPGATLACAARLQACRGRWRDRGPSASPGSPAIPKRRLRRWIRRGGGHICRLCSR